MTIERVALADVDRLVSRRTAGRRDHDARPLPGPRALARRG